MAVLMIQFLQQIDGYGPMALLPIFPIILRFWGMECERRDAVIRISQDSQCRLEWWRHVAWTWGQWGRVWWWLMNGPALLASLHNGIPHIGPKRSMDDPSVASQCFASWWLHCCIFGMIITTVISIIIYWSAVTCYLTDFSLTELMMLFPRISQDSWTWWGRILTGLWSAGLDLLHGCTINLH